ncbi:MAG TPA: RNA methyltransferase [Burkholderiales bacterium]|nr:RNA methyltransferase [Burkholderiales bacterium]
MPDVSLLNRVRIVLCGTSHPGNIGATARAMKTMGLASLYLVNPQRFPDADAVAMASSAADVLERAVVCRSIDEALTGTVFAAACTARNRDLSHTVLTARETGARLVCEAAHGPVGLVFGPEKTGLTAKDVSRCGAIAMIPTNPNYTSLNLAAAVQIFAYELRQSVEVVSSYPQEIYEPASYEEVELFFRHLEQTLYDIAFLDPKHPKRLMQRLRRLFQRTRLEKEEVNILRGVLSAAQKPRAEQ